jgi:hypothetical protein
MTAGSQDMTSKRAKAFRTACDRVPEFKVR